MRDRRGKALVWIICLPLDCSGEVVLGEIGEVDGQDGAYLMEASMEESSVVLKRFSTCK